MIATTVIMSLNEKHSGLRILLINQFTLQFYLIYIPWFLITC